MARRRWFHAHSPRRIDTPSSQYIATWSLSRDSVWDSDDLQMARCISGIVGFARRDVNFRKSIRTKSPLSCHLVDACSIPCAWRPHACGPRPPRHPAAGCLRPLPGFLAYTPIPPPPCLLRALLSYDRPAFFLSVSPGAHPPHRKRSPAQNPLGRNVRIP